MTYRTVLVCDMCKKDIDTDLMWYKVHNYKWIKVKEFREGDLPEMQREGHLCSKCEGQLETVLHFLEIPFKTKLVEKNKPLLRGLADKIEYGVVYVG